jgi:hypothetical protein
MSWYRAARSRVQSIITAFPCVSLLAQFGDTQEGRDIEN